MSGLISMNIKDVARFALNEAESYLNNGVRTLRPETQRAASRVSSLGEGSIAAAGRGLSAMPSINIDNSDRSWNFGSRPVYHTHVNNAPAPVPVRKSAKEEDEEKEKKTQETNYGALAAGVGILFGAVAVAGFVYKSYTKENAKLEERYAYANANQLLTNNEDLLIQAMIRVQEPQTSRINQYALACLSMIAGATSLIIGSFVAAPILIPSGAVLTIASVALALFTYTSHLDDEEVLREGYLAQKIFAKEVIKEVVPQLIPSYNPFFISNQASAPPASAPLASIDENLEYDESIEVAVAVLVGQEGLSPQNVKT